MIELRKYAIDAIDGLRVRQWKDEYKKKYIPYYLANKADKRIEELEQRIKELADKLEEAEDFAEWVNERNKDLEARLKEAEEYCNKTIVDLSFYTGGDYHSNAIDNAIKKELRHIKQLLKGGE